jgi:nucleoside-diphosphate-sugar epimerase
MSHNILITGGSGYLGGTLLARMAGANLPSYGKLYALVRTDEQFEAIKQYGCEPLKLDLQDEKAVHDAIVCHQITIVYHLIDPMNSNTQVNLIKALAEVKNSTGKDVHFLHVR